MARLIERSFSPNETVVARRMFVAAGRHYNPGDVFDWRRLAVAQRRVKQLFDNGKLMHPAQDTKPAAPTPAPTIAQEMQDEDIQHVAAEIIGDKPDVTLEQSDASAPNGEMFEAELATDDLDEKNMKELRAIADAEGAPFRVSRDAQREAIREIRRERAGG